LSRLSISLSAPGSKLECAHANIDGLTTDWRKLRGTFDFTNEADANSPYCLTLAAESPGQLVVAHLFLWPADHIGGADPDVVRLLKAAHLPLLRWPGGNFVSAYHWEDGVGAIETRPTKPNWAWGGVEPNTFGTDEFMSFCRAVGCEPMICVNAGTGTPEEAARWVEYCNGPVTSRMGARRATNGHPAPYHVQYWEVGNELWGRWQAHWTTPGGYVDRYLRFVEAMHAVNPAVTLYACGAPVSWGKAWNDTLITNAGPELHRITDHPLIGGDVPRSTEPLDVFTDFMRVPDVLEVKWSNLREDMLRSGIQEPRLAITELQMFAHLGAKPGANETERLNRENLVTPATLGEALYDTLMYHAAVRLQPFVELVTHSATVNHGGGLRKEHERVYANPCYYANAFFADFAGARPVKVEMASPKQRTSTVLPDLRNIGSAAFNVLDAVAALSTNGDLLISLVHRGTQGPIRVALTMAGYSAGSKAFVRTLSGSLPWSANTLEEPETVRPVAAEQEIRNGSMALVVKPFSVVQIALPKTPGQ
jgi:alpha-N-arabinofuranosidase